MQIANRLVKQGVNRSAAMIRAWILVKLNRITVKAVGVTFGIRQQLLHRLAKYQPQDVKILLRRERENIADSNAVQVIAAVRGKGKAVIGYLNREIAACIAALMDIGKTVYSRFGGITGGEECCLTYGLNETLSDFPNNGNNFMFTNKSIQTYRDAVMHIACVFHFSPSRRSTLYCY